MRYTDNIDKYLQNSPNPMIKHCLLKKGRGDNMDKIGIKKQVWENFLYVLTKMMKSDYTVLILVLMKEWPIAPAQTGKCWHIGANIFFTVSINL